MKYIIVLMLVFNVTSIFSQQEEASNIILSYSENQDIYFYEYKPRLKITAAYLKRSEALNAFPEQLMQSVLSATNQEWVNYNTLDGEEKANKKTKEHFDQIKKMVRDKNYFELHHKLSFNIDNTPTTIIKFYLYQENTPPVSGAMLMQKFNDRWYTTSRPDLSMFTIMIMRFKSDILKGVILGNSADDDVIELHNKVKDSSGVNLKLLEKEFFEWYTPEKEYKKELYIDVKAW